MPYTKEKQGKYWETLYSVQSIISCIDGNGSRKIVTVN